MKIVEMDSGDLYTAISGSDPVLRNKAFRSLYLNPTVLGKIREWMQYYRLADREAEDILQEGMVLLDKLIRNGKFRGESQVQTFLLAICRNLIRDGIKKVKRVVFTDELPTASEKIGDEEYDHMEFEEKKEEETRRENALRDAIQRLTAKCQELLRLYYFEQKSMREVAQERNLSSQVQARKAAHRCRERLRELLRQNPLFNPAKG